MHFVIKWEELDFCSEMWKIRKSPKTNVEEGRGLMKKKSNYSIPSAHALTTWLFHLNFNFGLSITTIARSLACVYTLLPASFNSILCLHILLLLFHSALLSFNIMASLCLAKLPCCLSIRFDSIRLSGAHKCEFRRG